MAAELDSVNENIKPLKIDDGRSVFSGWPTLVFLAGMLVFTFHACTHMVAAGDTWVAMACGRHHSNHGVDTVEPFSANSHKAGPTKETIKTWPKWARNIAGKFDIETVKKWHPTGWVNQNWLTHTTFYQFAKRLGRGGEYNYDGLVYWKFIIFTIEVFSLFFFARLIGVSVPSSAGASAMAMFVGRTFLDIRPACYANVLAAILLLIMALAIYKNYRYIWLIVPLTVFWSNVHGGYIYVFMMMFPFIGFNFICIPFQKRFYSVGIKGVYHAIGAGFAAFFAMVLFNPFHLTNLTHTFEISLSEHAESWRSVNEWHSAFKLDNPVGSSWPFLIMFIIMWVVLILWCITRFLRPVVQVNTRRRARQKTPDIFKKWPKVNPAFIFIAGLSVYMAVKSRRFIPIAAGAACPVMAMMLEQSVRMILSKRNFLLKGKLEMPALPVKFNRGVIIFAAVVTLAFGGFWGAKFKKIYLDPWPNDNIRDSVFMRMTASNVKPFDVCQFMRDNELSGNMFNYWTEGGALAFGQKPDPKTGRTPLQLFQDGRAQAAYSHEDFQTWRRLYGGGAIRTKDGRVIPNDERRANRLIKNGSEDMKLIGEFLNKEMKKRDIWVFVLPSSQFRPNNEPGKVNYFPLAMSAHPEWVLVYMDDHQQMYVNKTMKKGKDLYNKVLKKQAKFPNEYSENLTLSAVNLSRRPATVKQVVEGFNYAKKAFNISASNSSMSQIRRASGYGPVRKRAITFAEKYIQDFITNKEKMSEEGGYAMRLDAARVGIYFLARTYSKSNPKKAKEYSEYSTQFTKERGKIALEYKW
ncbi:MAG: hypothetical protein FVQ82_06755 [Planctomycetes bacterium]|nr:hypothetical protein [Planctomycetota bacterium]